MAKSEALNQTQNIKSASVGFNYSDVLNVIAVAPTANGTNLTPGTRTFTAAGGTTVSGGAGAATWTCTASGGAGAARLNGIPVITQKGEYTATPTVSANAAAVDSGTSDATWAVTVGSLKEIYTAGTNDAIVKAINVTSTDTAARVVSIWRQCATGQPLDLVVAGTVAIAAGSSGSAAVQDLLSAALIPGAAIDAAGKRVIPLQAGAKLFASVPAVTASCFIRVNLMAEEF